MSEAHLHNLIKKYALQNAVLYGGVASSKAVVGKVLAEEPELRRRAKEVNILADEVVKSVNALTPEDQREMLAAIDVSLLKREKVERAHPLPPLPKAERGKVVMRFAPGPSGPLHIGHTRVAILNDEYVKMYDGKFVNRIEDTNPEKIDPEAYRTIPEDLEWLGVKVHETVIQTDRLELYYEVARKLIEIGQAYVCTCPVEDWRRLKEESRPCPHRNLAKEIQHEEFDRMLAGGYEEEQAVLVVKTDLSHPNPAIRDFVGFRIVRSVPHPRTGTKYCVYPMMNFSVAVDDHYLGLTHVLRGKDHLNNTYRQEYIFKYLGWEKPWYYHYGLVSIPDTILKTSIVGKGIRSGEYTGWDDVHLGTVRALKRRGITAEAIRDYWLDVGLKEVDIQFSWDTLYAFNRKRIDPVANRYFFVWEPVTLGIHGIEKLESYAPLHPDRPERGVRRLVLEGSPIEVLVNKQDFDALLVDGKIRLKDLCNLEVVDGRPTYMGNDLSVLKDRVKIIHWVPKNSAPALVEMPEGPLKQGFAEPIGPSEIGKVVQFERFGFVRIEAVDPAVHGVFTQD